MDTAELCRIFISGDSRDVVFRPDAFLRPALLEYMRRAVSIPRLGPLTRDLWSGGGDSRWSDLGHPHRRAGADRPVRQRRGRALPARRFTRRGRSNDFRTVGARCS
ncbi:hypothetical protein [Thermomonas sp.]|uniref:hypothetical protein n=1 Tax=Thermomonas sp. TaxID=1971895 RepID=UPI0026363A52|nr:hypothetical protein [Thermomonas sp.]